MKSVCNIIFMCVYHALRFAAAIKNAGINVMLWSPTHCILLHNISIVANYAFRVVPVITITKLKVLAVVRFWKRSYS